MKRLFLLVLALAPFGHAQFAHRAEQDLEIRYWLLDPATHQFRISHDFTITRVGQKSVHSFVRKGSEVAPDSKMFDLDTGEPLHTHLVSGKEVNALPLNRVRQKENRTDPAEALISISCHLRKAVRIQPRQVVAACNMTICLRNSSI